MYSWDLSFNRFLRTEHCKHEKTQALTQRNINTQQFEKVPSVIWEMKKNGLSLDKYSYNYWMKSYAALSDMDKVEEVLNEIILANLPASDSKLTASLIEYEALPTIIKVMKNGTFDAKENAVGALLRFTDPSSVGTQHTVVNLGAYPILISLLHSGTMLAKTKAAFAIGNLSLSSPYLSVAPIVNGCLCFMSTKPPVCRVHRGPCDVKTTFCLVKANALSALVNLLQEREGNTAGAAVHALATLVSDDTQQV
jgi:pentatricopeptide repeat protein